MKRIPSIDIARGLVMVIMALDHTRDLLHINSMTQNPVDLATTTPILFFTRWITHLCAPSFVFLSGASAWLSLQNRKEGNKGRRFLLSRGIWLIVLEFTLINFALWFDIHFRTLMFQVIAAIGSGLIILSFLNKVSPKIIGIAGLALLFGHDLLSNVMLPLNPALRFIVSLFLSPGLFQPAPDFTFFVAYPILPWLGIMLTGYAAGRLFQRPAEGRKIIFIRLGLAALGLFIILRFTNVYGDPFHWSVQKNGVFTFLSFINVTKYPPSLLYCLLMLGLLFLFLSFLEGRDSSFLRMLSVYGKTPLFYYLLHWYLLRLIFFIVIFAQGFHAADLEFGPRKFGRPGPATTSGLSLFYVYLVWLGIVALLYPLCRWYGRYRSAHPENKWLRYL
jgi:uncharacterized membrane protein